ncbi:hypothetical protein GCM10027186_14990 [Micromonospora schwarzwaldensis]
MRSAVTQRAAVFGSTWTFAASDSAVSPRAAIANRSTSFANGPLPPSSLDGRRRDTPLTVASLDALRRTIATLRVHVCGPPACCGGTVGGRPERPRPLREPGRAAPRHGVPGRYELDGVDGSRR